MCGHGIISGLLHPRIEETPRRYGSSNPPKSDAIFRNHTHRSYPKPILKRHLQNRRSPPSNIQHVLSQHHPSSLCHGRDIYLHASIRHPNPPLRINILLHSTILPTNLTRIKETGKCHAESSVLAFPGIVGRNKYNPSV